MIQLFSNFYLIFFFEGFLNGLFIHLQIYECFLVVFLLLISSFIAFYFKKVIYIEKKKNQSKQKVLVLTEMKLIWEDFLQEVEQSLFLCNILRL